MRGYLEFPDVPAEEWPKPTIIQRIWGYGWMDANAVLQAPPVPSTQASASAYELRVAATISLAEAYSPQQICKTCLCAKTV